MIFYFFMQAYDPTYDPNYAATYHQNYGPSYNQVTDKLILFENIHIRPQQVWSPDATYDPNYSGEIQVTGMISNFATGFQKVPFFLKIDQNQWFQNSRFHFYLVFIWK